MSLASSSAQSAKSILASLSRSAPKAGRLQQHLKPSTAHFSKLLSSDPSSNELKAAVALYTQAGQALSSKNLGALARHLCFTQRTPDILRQLLTKPQKYSAVRPTRILAREWMRGTVAQLVKRKGPIDGIWQTLAILAMRDATLQQDLSILGTALWAMLQLDAETEVSKALAEEIATRYHAERRLTDVSEETLDTATAWRLQLDYAPLLQALSQCEKLPLTPEAAGMLKKLKTAIERGMATWGSVNSSIGRKWEEYIH